MTIHSIIDLNRKANDLRNRILEASIESGGHLASSFSCLEILMTLYHTGILRFNPEDPGWPERDRFILSKGHGELALYTVLADVGFFPSDWLQTRYRRGDCLLGGHPDNKIPGVEVTTGAVGHGLGLAAGISLAAKMDGKSHLQYVVLGDAECTEGSIWEAALFSSNHGLNNLTCIVDRNHMGVLDSTENFTGLHPLSDKWAGFGWDVVEADGHDFQSLLESFQSVSKRNREKPSVIIAETVKGKGISFVENVPAWHAMTMSKEDEIKQARGELVWRESGEV